MTQYAGKDQLSELAVTLELQSVYLSYGEPDEPFVERLGRVARVGINRHD
jgi:hypothetical protein